MIQTTLITERPRGRPVDTEQQDLKTQILDTAEVFFSDSGYAATSIRRIAEKADVTVMMWVRGKVKVNHALTKGELTEKKIAEIVADTAKILE